MQISIIHLLYNVFLMFLLLQFEGLPVLNNVCSFFYNIESGKNVRMEICFKKQKAKKQW